MVFQKKSTPKRNQTPNKMKGKKSLESSKVMDFEEMDSDESDDSEEMNVKQTPRGKALKEKPTSDKKVTFNIQGKGTPAKNQKEDSFLGKKQLTPGMKGNISLKEFKGMKANGKRKAGEEDDDDDDDDEDDDDDDDDEDDDLDLDMDMDEDDDDDDDDDDEDDDDDDDDDEEDEDDVKTKKLQNKTPVKTAEKTKTPVKVNENSNANKTPNKGAVTQSPQKSPKKEQKTPKKDEKSPKVEYSDQIMKSMKTNLDQKRERDRRSLFVGNLPVDVTSEELKALSTDILSVILPSGKPKKHLTKKFGFLIFASEAKAEENINILQKKKFRNAPLTIDYAGEKSKQRAIKVEPSAFAKNKDLRKLYVTALPIDITIDQVAKHFNSAVNISLNFSTDFRTAHVGYTTEKLAAEDFEANQNVTIAGQKIFVVYANLKEKSSKKRKGKPNKPASNKPAAKKIKLQPKVVEDDDDDDDDDDDEDDE